MRNPPDLVIFDCDGVLIDSERLAVEVDLLVLERVGLAMSRQEVVECFVGQSASVIEAVIEAHLGHPLAPELAAEFEQLYVDTFERDLVAVPGIAEVLARLDRPSCVASNSDSEGLYSKLRQVGLYEHFAGHIFSADQVPSGKPAPDLFLYAAARMGVEPARCLVVEDSRHGVIAARAAGMPVLAFASGLVDPESLRGPGTTLFTEMSELLALIEDSGAQLTA